MLHFDESMRLLDKLQVNEYKTQRLYIMDALGYVLAQDIVADHNSPEFLTSAMDGYALKYEDISLGKLPIDATNPAGNENVPTLKPQTCIKTFTGSLMPEGSDTLIPIEYVRVEDNSIIIDQEVQKGFSVREVGENYAKGDVLIQAGTKIDFSAIGVLASLNIVYIDVYQKPKVAVVSTGSELLELGEIQTSPSQIRSSNNYTIEAIVRKYDGDVISCGCVKDDKESIYSAIDKALKSSDIVVTTGGVSVGDYDFVKDVISELGASVVFKGVRIKPGQHIIVAKKDDKFIVSLPGFAYSSTVTALLYVVPLIQKFQKGNHLPRYIQATLKEPFVKRAKKAEFTACNISLEDGKYYVDFTGKKVGTSAIMTNMLGDIALVYTSEDDSSKETGEAISVLLV
jgi:molybdopterin molybdotransferase